MCIRDSLKGVIHDKKRTPEERFQAMLVLQTLPRNASPVRQRNRCSMTGRSRGYYRRFGVSRIVMREMAARGQLPGVVKSSW
ncbi:MAG: 30S ribosomal protein S14 [Alphaproteobacteria bacterium]|nr:30S ribosomal protein S14 [Alphaproteobacteria bacterium]